MAEPSSPRKTTVAVGAGSASEQAVEAVAHLAARPRSSDWGEGLTISRIEAVLAAAHDPALGLDRSVCLRDVVEWLRREARPSGRCGLFPERLPDLLAGDFGGAR